MDRLIFTAMTGAKQAMQRQDSLANNLANASTVGFRAEMTAHRAVPVRGPGEGARVFAVESTPGTDFSTGTIQQTGRPLDVAIHGRGFFTVRAPDGGEAYTRAGSFHLDQDGNLLVHGRHAVMGDGGPLNVPIDNRIEIAPDGTVSAIPESGNLNSVTVIGRIKLVKPEEKDLVKGTDGLFRMRSGETLPLDETVTLTPGAVEGSNVNVVEAMVEMIAIARQFDMQMKMLSTAEADSRTSAQLLNVNS